MLKRLIDVVVSTAALALLSPLIVLTAILVRLRLGSPVIFMQERPGLNGVPFTLRKFRTMSDERDEDGVLVPTEQRLTRFGRRLRETSLDELPELVNVLRGQMSLVGPRPLRMEYLAEYDETQMRRHETRPGLTGLAQVSGRNEVGWARRFELDVWYVDNRSLRLDLQILFRSIAVAVSSRGVHTAEGATVTPFQNPRTANDV